MAIKFGNPLKIGGYIRVEEPFQTFYPLMDWVVVQEDLAQDGPQALVLIEKDHTKQGKILKLGDRAIARTGLQVGDRIVYTEWDGGRWEFPDLTRDGGMIRVLIMDCFGIQALIQEDDDGDS